MNDENLPDLSQNRRLKIHHWMDRHFFGLLRRLGIPGWGIGARAFRKIFPLPLVNGPVIVTCVNGIKLWIDPLNDQKIERQIFTSGIYEAGTAEVISRVLKPGDIVCDVGANIGVLSLSAAKVVGDAGKVYAFEPARKIYEILRFNIALNHFTHVVPENFALGSRSQEGIIYAEENINRGASSMVKPYLSGSAQKIQVLTLDEYLLQNRIPHLNLLKIDVEGWEIEVLKGAQKLLAGKDAPVVIIEYSENHPVSGGILTDIYDYLANINRYQIFKLRRGKETVSRLVKVDSPKLLPKHDNLFCFLPHHISELPANLFAN